jgi:hypothetical protein
MARGEVDLLLEHVPKSTPSSRDPRGHADERAV